MRQTTIICLDDLEDLTVHVAAALAKRIIDSVQSTLSMEIQLMSDTLSGRLAGGVAELRAAVASAVDEIKAEVEKLRTLANSTGAISSVAALDTLAQLHAMATALNDAVGVAKAEPAATADGAAAGAGDAATEPVVEPAAEPVAAARPRRPASGGAETSSTEV